MQLGHTDLTCNNKPICGHCAREHLTINCSFIHFPPKCAIGCKEPHKGTDKNCSLWKTHVIRIAVTKRQNYTKQKQANAHKSTLLQRSSHHGQRKDRTTDHHRSHITNQHTKTPNRASRNQARGWLQSTARRHHHLHPRRQSKSLTLSGLISQIQCFAGKLSTFTTTFTAISQSSPPSSHKK